MVRTAQQASEVQLQLPTFARDLYQSITTQGKEQSLKA